MRRSSSLAAVASNGDDRSTLHGPQRHETGGGRILDHPRPHVAHVQVACDGEEPGSQPRIRAQAVGMLHQPQPRLFEQVFRDVVATGQAQQKGEQAEIEGVVDGIEGRLVAAAKLLNERQLGVRVHRSHNARRDVA